MWAVGGKASPMRLAGNRCQTGTCVFNVSSATSFLETQSASTEAGHETAASYFTSVSLRPIFNWVVESQNKNYKNKRRTHSLVDLERRPRTISWGSAGTTQLKSHTLLLPNRNSEKNKKGP